MKYYKIIVYKKKDETYYFKKIKSYCSSYDVGYENSYGHKVILVIDVLDLISHHRKSLRNRALDKLIARLERMKRK